VGFFDTLAVTKLIEGNINRVVQLEESEAKKLLVVYKDVRRELVDRLSLATDGSFTEQQLRVTLVQVTAAMQALTTRLKQQFHKSVNGLAVQSVTDLTKEIQKFSKEFEGSIQPINLDAVFITQDARNFLFNQHQTSIDAYGQDVLRNVARGITQSLVSRDTLGQVVTKLNKFMLVEEFKLQRLARTELHNVYNLGKLQAMRLVKQETLPDLKKTLIHPMDNRTGADSVQLKALNPIVAVDKPFKFTFNGKERVFMAPPDRPNDRAILVPYRKVWDN